MAYKKPDVYIADFETTVYEGQTRTDVWAAAIVKMDDPDEPESVEIYNNINDFMKRILTGGAKIVYFHNLKFDGSFIMNWILNNKKYKPYGYINKNNELIFFDKPWKMPRGYFSYSISDKGLWYNINIRSNECRVEIRDSLKLLPFSVRKIGKDFQTKHKKLEMEYEGIRFPGGKITEEERAYIANDVLVVKEALRWMYNEGHDKLTIGGCCLSEYKSLIKANCLNWDAYFPNLYDEETEKLPQYLYNAINEIDEETAKSLNIQTIKTPGDFIRMSYHGGWCYTVPEAIGRVFKPIEENPKFPAVYGKSCYNKIERRIAGTTADVNSLYPSMMHSMSGNYYPIGQPTFFEGEIPEEIKDHTKYYYFICFRAKWKIKSGYLPTVQIKGTLKYPGREWLTSSEVTDRQTGKTADYAPLLVMTQTDWELLNKHYDIRDLKIYGGCYFKSMTGLFDDYIDKYAKIKQTSKGAMRQLAKLMLNSIYGKFATSTDSSYKTLTIDESGVLKMGVVSRHDKTPGYIPIGAAITSYARNFTITAAQKNYHPGKRGFIYADTDSIHCDLLPEEIEGAPEHPTEFCHWKYESNWSEGYFMGAKRYAEKHSYEDGEKLETEKWDIKCAGMSDHCKKLFIASITGEMDKKEKEKLSEEEKEFVETNRDITDFKVGLTVPGMLKARQIPGGVLLIKSDYKMRPANKWI